MPPGTFAEEKIISDLYKFIINGTDISWLELRRDGTFELEDLKRNETLSFDAASGKVTLTGRSANFIKLETFSRTASTTDDSTLYTKPVTTYTALDGTPIAPPPGEDPDLGGSNDLDKDGSDDDDYVGGNRNDYVRGGSGNDKMRGGTGADRLSGGLGADHFDFADVDALGLRVVDRILDFSHAQGDVIDLSVVDADSRTEGDQAFAYIGNARFSGEAGELMLKINGSTMTLLGGTNGDAYHGRLRPLRASPKPGRAGRDVFGHRGLARCEKAGGQAEGSPHQLGRLCLSGIGREGGDYAPDFHSDLKALQILGGSVS